MKKNIKTFAQRAKDIQKKYTRANFDPVEKKDMDDELEALMNEQEQVRTSIEQEELACGGKVKYPDGGSIDSTYVNLIKSNFGPDWEKAYKIMEAESGGNAKAVRINNDPKFTDPNGENWNTKDTGLFQLNSKWQPQAYKAGDLTNPEINIQEAAKIYKKYGWTPWTSAKKVLNKENNSNYTLGNNNSIIPSQLDVISSFPIPKQGDSLFKKMTPKSGIIKTDNQLDNRTLMSNNINNDKKGKEKNINEYLPFLVSGATNLIGNLLLANMAKKAPKINTPLANAEEINLESKAEQLRRDTSTSKNINMTNARNLGTNASSTLANMGVLNSMLDRGLGDNLTNLYLGQEQFNKGAKNTVNLANVENTSRAGIYNSQMKQSANQMKLGFLDDAVTTIPGMMNDITSYDKDKELRAILAAQAKNAGGKNYYMIGDLFSKDGLTYKVKKVDKDGNILQYERT